MRYGAKIIKDTPFMHVVGIDGGLPESRINASRSSKGKVNAASPKALDRVRNAIGRKHDAVVPRRPDRNGVVAVPCFMALSPPRENGERKNRAFPDPFGGGRQGRGFFRRTRPAVL